MIFNLFEIFCKAIQMKDKFIFLDDNNIPPISLKIYC
jgi:hypothetical protein